MPIGAFEIKCMYEESDVFTGVLVRISRYGS